MRQLVFAFAIFVCAESAAAQSDNVRREVFRANVLLERVEIDDQSGREERLPAVKYELKKSIEHGVRRTIITYLKASPFSRDPLEGMRVEFDDNGSPLRIYDRAGNQMSGTESQPLAVVPAELRAAPHGGSLFTPKNSRSERERQLRRDLGAPAGTWRGHDRYLQRDGTREQEVLVSPITAMPSAITVSENGMVVSSTTFEYEELPDGSLLRKSWRSEARTADGRRRSVTTMTVSDVVASR